MERLSLEKIAKGDIIEQARLLFTVAPSKFTTLAKHQGVKIETLEEAQELAQDIVNKESDFNWNKFARNLPISIRDIKKARANGLRID